MHVIHTGLINMCSTNNREGKKKFLQLALYRHSHNQIVRKV